MYGGFSYFLVMLTVFIQRGGIYMQAFLGEVIGTMILIILGAGVCAGVNLKIVCC